MSDEKNDYTTDELAFADKAMLRIGATVAAETIRRGAKGVAATTREIVEAMIKERREMRSNAIALGKDSPTSRDSGTDKRTPGQTAYEAWLGLPHTRDSSPKPTPWNMLQYGEKQEWQIIASAVIDRHGTILEERKTRLASLRDRRSIRITEDDQGSCFYEIMVKAPDGNPLTNGAKEKLDLVDDIARMLGLEFGDGSKEQPTSKTETPARDELVERIGDLIDAHMGGGESCNEVATAILTELAKASVELPSAREIADWFDADHRGGETLIEATQRLSDRIRGNVAPILTAKDAALEHLDGLAKRYEEQSAKRAELETFPERIRERIQAVKGTDLVRAVGDLFSFHDYSRRAMNDEGIPATNEKGERNSEMLRLMMYIDKNRVHIADLKHQMTELKTQCANRDRMVNEWYGAIDALNEVWPKDVPYAKDNPTHAEWIHDLVNALGEKAKRETVDLLEQIKHEADTHDTSVGQEHRAIMMPVLNQILGEEIAKLRQPTPERPWVALAELPSGAVFETKTGVRAVKSKYLLDFGGHECVSLVSGEYVHFAPASDAHNATPTRELRIP